MSRTEALEYIRIHLDKVTTIHNPHDSDLAEKITIIIKAFERPLCIAWSIVSIKKYFPSLRVLVCDDSREPLFKDGEEPFPNIVWHTKPYEDGHSPGAGRNFLTEKVKTKYYFLTDDDVQFTKKSDLRKMHEFLEKSNYDIVGGTQTQWDYGAANFEVVDDILIEKHYAHRGQILPGFVKCDRVSNAFLARTKTVEPIKWEDRVNKNYHADFFYRAKIAALKVAQMGRFNMIHNRKCEECETFSDWLKGKWSGHSSVNYRIAMYGGGESEEAARADHKKRYGEVILKKNNLIAIKDDKSQLRLLKLFFQIGHPFLNLTKPVPKSF